MMLVPSPVHFVQLTALGGTQCWSSEPEGSREDSVVGWLSELQT